MIIFSAYIMSFTRFHDDPCRVAKQLEEATGPGRYVLNVPGNGPKPYFMEDPFVRLQRWGANLMTNPVDLESDLLGLSNRLGCSADKKPDLPRSSPIEYPSCTATTQQPRATDPAWTARDLEQVNWYILPMDPQENVCMPFPNNLDTRILEKDYFVAKAPCLLDDQ